MRHLRKVSGKIKKLKLVGFDVLIAVAMKCSAFWGMMPCSQVKVSRRQARNHYAGCLLDFLFDPEDRRYAPLKRRFTFTVLHGVITRRTEQLVIVD